MSETPLAVSLIVPVHRGAPAFARCLAAIAGISPPPDEVLVVCAGEAPEEARLARARGHEVIELKGSCGPARARNAGAGAARGPILFFVDSDVEVPPSVVSRVEARFREDPGLTALFGSYDAEPSEPSFLSQYRNLLHHFVHQASSAEAWSFWGACGAIRRDRFLEVSGFDETYLLPSVEDIELGYRLNRAGHRILLDKTLQVKHLKRWDLRSMLRADVLQRARPWGTLILEGRSPTRDLNLGAASRLSVVGVGALLPTLAATFRYPALLIPALAIAVALVLLNLPFYRFLTRNRGVWFAARAIPCHWLFYACGGLGFGLAILGFLGPPSRRASSARGARGRDVE